MSASARHLIAPLPQDAPSVEAQRAADSGGEEPANAEPVDGMLHIEAPETPDDKLPPPLRA